MPRPRVNHKRECKYAGYRFSQIAPEDTDDCVCVLRLPDEIEFAETDVIGVDPAVVERISGAWHTIYLENPPDGFDAAVRAMIVLGADEELMVYAVTVTATQLHVENKFAYMAGIVRNIVGRESTRRMMEDDD